MQKGFIHITLLVLFILSISIILFYFALKNGAIRSISQDNFKNSPTMTVSSTVTAIPTITTTNWKTYRNEKLGFELSYPKKLKFFEKNGVVNLSHSIPYENHGDCDMIVGKFSKTLNDFDISFEIKDTSQVEEMQYTDGIYEAGILKGIWQYTGAEGCGGNLYHFDLTDNKTLIVTRNIAQAFTGNSTMWDMDKILNTPGVITQSESDQIFRAILTTFKIKNTINFRTIKLYYHDNKLDPQLAECVANNYTEKAIPVTNTPIKDTLNALIDSGLLANPPEFKLISTNLKDGILYLEFPEIPSYTTGGSCHIGVISSQIIDTAKQFPQVKQVIFNPEIFQP